MPDKVSSPLASGWWTSEFGSALIAVAGNIIALLVILKLVPPDQATSITDRVTAVITLLGVILGNSGVSARFIKSRETIKVKALEVGAPKVENTQEFPPWVRS